MIIVTGATGQLGHAIALQLSHRLPASQIGVSVRDPAKASDLEALGIRVRAGNFEDGSSLRHAFEGASQVLIVSSNARAYGGDSLAQHRAAIDAAKAVGARRILYTSHMAVSDTSAFHPMLDHHATEAMLAESGLAWTSLRNGFYGQSGLALMGDALKTGLIEAPADGKVSWTAHADLAEAAAIILADEGSYEGPTPPLTSSEALDLSDLAALASGLLGREITRETITDDTLRTRMLARGLPERVIAISLGLYRASRDGEFAQVDPTLEKLLGRPPIRMLALIATQLG